MTNAQRALPQPEHYTLSRELVERWSGKPWGLWASGMRDYEPALCRLDTAVAQLLAAALDAKDRHYQALVEALENIAALKPDYTWPEEYTRQVREISRAALAALKETP